MAQDPLATYQIPTEWTLHADAHRTATTVGFPQPSSATPVEYSLEGSPCADAPQSQPAYPPGPEVIGPGGTVVGTIQLRTWHSCEVVWPRIVWDHGPDLDTDATYQIPSGWTLHVLTVRPATGSTFDYPEPASGAPVPYALGKMASTARDCVYVEVYFTDGVEPTPSARTDCIHHSAERVTW